MRRLLSLLVATCAVLPVVVPPQSTAAAESATIDGLFAGTGPLTGGVATTMKVTGRGGVPASGVAAVALNVTVTEPSTTGYLTVWPTGSPQPYASNLNFAAGQTVANSVLTKVGENGEISLSNNAGTTNVVIDVLGWLPAGQTFAGLTPARIADTRNSPTIDGLFMERRPRRAGTVDEHRRAGPRRGAADRCERGRLERDRDEPDRDHRSSPCGPPAERRPTASNLNFVAGQDGAEHGHREGRPRRSASPCTTTRQRRRRGRRARVVRCRQRLQRARPPPSARHPTGIVARRRCRTRGADRWPAGGVPPSGVGGVALNVTVTNPSDPSYLTVWPTGVGAADVVEPQLRRRRRRCRTWSSSSSAPAAGSRCSADAQR